MPKFVIIPGCSDLNRGDQALVWETKRLAEDCGFKGDFYLTTEKNEPTRQSEKIGLNIITPIMEHPSRVFRSKENISYNASLKFKWGLVALWDLFTSMFYFTRPTRSLINLFINADKQNSLKAMEEADALFMKGGGLLQTYGGISSTYSMYFWTFHILLAKSMNKPIFVMPNSFGPFEGPFVKYIARKALKSCTVLTSRETYSQKMVMEQLNLETENFPDLAFYLPKAELDKEAIFRKFQLPTDRKLIAMTMRPYRFPQSKTPEEDYGRFKKEMADFIRWLYLKGYMPVIIEHTLAINAHENDGACIKEVTALLNESEYRLISDASYDCYQLKCIYSFCDYIIGTRFHSVIFSISSGLPGIAITYAGNKAQGIMHDIGLDDYVIGIGEVRAEFLKKKFEKLVNEENDVRKKIAAYRSLALERRNDLIKKITKK